jgi:hypothetical protein
VVIANRMMSGGLSIGRDWWWQVQKGLDVLCRRKSERERRYEKKEQSRKEKEDQVRWRLKRR